MYKLKNIVEQVGRKRQIDEALPRVDGVYLRKGMKVQIKPEKEFLENHYYENHPQDYKKLAQQIAGTVQEVEEIGPSKSSFDTDDVKLIGFDLWIESGDIESIIDFKGVIHLDSMDMTHLTWKLYHITIDFIKSETDIDVDKISYKEAGKIIRDVANYIAKEGKKPKEKF